MELEQMTLKALQALARKQKYPGRSKATRKADLISFIRAERTMGIAEMFAREDRVARRAQSDPELVSLGLDTLEERMMFTSNDGFYLTKFSTSAKGHLFSAEIASEEGVLDPSSFFRDTNIALITELLRELFARLGAGPKKFQLGFNVVYPIKNKSFVVNNKMEALVDPDELTEANVLREIEFLIGDLEEKEKRYAMSGGVVQSCFIKATNFRSTIGSFVPLPSKISNRKATISFENKDEFCFKYAVACYFLDELTSSQRKGLKKKFRCLQKFWSEFNFEGIEFPITKAAAAFKRFEAQNPDYNLFVYSTGGSSDGKFFALYQSTRLGQPGRELNLLEHDGHFHWVRDFARCIGQTESKARRYPCKACMHVFTSQGALDRHAPVCSQAGRSGALKILPEPGSKLAWTSAKNHKKHLRDIVCYADFESMISPSGEHSCISYAYVAVLKGEEIYDSGLYRGQDAARKFLEAMIDLQKRVYDANVKNPVPIIMTAADEADFDAATMCHICQEPLSKTNTEGLNPVRDHDHWTGEYRGAAHWKCNTKYAVQKDIPVFFHNLSGYDAHYIVIAGGELKMKVSPIANTEQKYISIDCRRKDMNKGSIQFRDSLRHFGPGSSLEKLVSKLPKTHAWKLLSTRYPDPEQRALLTRKGVFPYTFLDGEAAFDSPCLPGIGAFYNDLSDTPCDPGDYEHALNVFSAFGMKNFGDYHDLYLWTDVLLLAEVYEAHRLKSHEAYGLDPSWYFTAPSLSWDCMLKMKHESSNGSFALDLITDMNMLDFVQEGMRGGISMISHRHAKANNPYLSDYDATKAKTWIFDWDANNLYGHAMSQPLPTGDFEWVPDADMTDLVLELTQKSDAELADMEHGYYVQATVSYPRRLHDEHSDYPLLPERMEITDDMISKVQLELRERLGMTRSNVPKLVPTLRDKKEYTCHVRLLRQAISLGLNIAKVHRVLKFKQSRWLKEYIDANTEKRKVAKACGDSIGSDYYKLLNNSCFGKTFEAVQNRMDFELCTEPKRFQHLVDEYSVKRTIDYIPDRYISGRNGPELDMSAPMLVGVERYKRQVKFDKPIYIGAAVMDLSKIVMYDFYYRTLLPEFGAENLKLLATDTDSLKVLVSTDRDMYLWQKSSDAFDRSEYPKSLPMHDLEQCAVLGKMKDELSDSGIISEFVGLRAKMYSQHAEKYGVELMVGEPVPRGVASKTKTKIVCKGVKRYLFGRAGMEHQDYIDCVNSTASHDVKAGRQSIVQTTIQSKKHKLMTATSTKVSLCAYDDKRWFLEDGIQTRAIGHWRNH